jgi:uncharacterized paraquat-inducible protein A
MELKQPCPGCAAMIAKRAAICPRCGYSLRDARLRQLSLAVGVITLVMLIAMVWVDLRLRH